MFQADDNNEIRWDVIFQNFNANFTFNSAHELTIRYDTSKGRNYETELFYKKCTQPITDIGINLASYTLWIPIATCLRR